MKKLNLNRYHEKFVKLIEQYQRENDLRQHEVAKSVGMQSTHFNALLRGAHDRPLTGYYIQSFIIGGIFQVDDIWDGIAESQQEAEFWRNMKTSERRSLLTIIQRLEDKGIDVEAVLKAMDTK